MWLKYLVLTLKKAAEHDYDKLDGGLDLNTPRRINWDIKEDTSQGSGRGKIWSDMQVKARKPKQRKSKQLKSIE